jgi:hypothetical protein
MISVKVKKLKKKTNITFSIDTFRIRKKAYSVCEGLKKDVARGTKLTGVLAFLFISALLLSVFSPSLQMPAYAEGELCATDVDAVLIMDVSGSMTEGASVSKCEWKQYELRNGTTSCYPYEENGLTEGECLAKQNPAPCSQLIYTPATQSKIASSKVAAKHFLDNLLPADQSSLVSFSDTAVLKKMLS